MYKVRVKGLKIYGPMNKKDLERLIQGGQLGDDDEYQYYPNGDWQLISSLDIENSEEKTFIKKISVPKQETSHKDEKEKSSPKEKEQEFPKEFDYTKIEGPTLDSNELTSLDDPIETETKRKRVSPETRIKTSVKPQYENNEDKTRITAETVEYLRQLKEQEEAENLKAQKVVKQEASDFDYESDATQVIDLNKKKLQSEIERNESDIDFEAQDHERKVIAKKMKAKVVDVEEEVFEEILERPTRKNRIVLIIAILLGILFLLDDDKKEKQVSFVEANLEYPIAYEKPNLKKSEKLLADGLKKIKSYRLKDVIDASLLFKESYENNTFNTKSAAFLIYTYSYLLDHISYKKRAANTIFKLVQVNGSRSLSSPELSTAISLFYLKSNKINAALKTVKDYLQAKEEGAGVTLEMMTVYLMAKMEKNIDQEAHSLASKLLSVPERPVISSRVIAKYFYNKGSKQTSLEIVDKALESTSDIPLLLHKAHISAEAENVEGLQETLNKIKKIGFGGSRLNYAGYLKYMGWLLTYKGDPENAIKYFEKSLSFHEDSELRLLLSQASPEGLKGANRLIQESKAIKFVNSSKKALVNYNVKKAYVDALTASQLAPDVISVQLHLAKMNIKQGIFGAALKSLEELFGKNPENKEITYALIEAYIDSYKFSDALRLISVLGKDTKSIDSRFFKYHALLYLKKGDVPRTLNWLPKAINNNPLDDQLIYELAKMFVENNQFKRAQVLLSQSIQLDPSNIDYRVLWSRILAEVDGIRAAIGYLYDILKDYPNNPRIKGEIAIYYYRNGQLKQFEDIKNELKSSKKSDPELFEFLIRASKLEGKLDDVIKYSEELIRIRPGDLQARLYLGRVYLERENYKEALKQFNRIKERLDTYPSLNFYLSKLYLLVDDLKKAKALALNEVKANPNIVDGHVLLANIELKEGNKNEAEEILKRAQRIDSNDLDVLIGLAKLNFEKSENQIALDLLLKAKDLDPSRVEIYRILGDVYRKIGQSGLAAENYKLFLELSPNTRYKSNLESYINNFK